ncbi:MAG: helix-turn-helix transcriptional regulator [Flavihumibacter sp.]
MTQMGANIKKIRTTKGLSQQAFADLFALTRGNISSYEENRAEPRIETVVRIANYFCIPLDHFITRSLTINQILQFNGDTLLEEESVLQKHQLKEVPFIGEGVTVRLLQSLPLPDFGSLPALVLPDSSPNRLLAVAWNPAIPHHESLSGYTRQDVLVFEEVNHDNVHLCREKTGLYISDKEMMIGRFAFSGDDISLVLNQFRQHAFSSADTGCFWKLFSSYRHAND